MAILNGASWGENLSSNLEIYFDQIYGHGGNDTLNGGYQNDSLYGGDGDDDLYGNNGNDDLRGEQGNDEAYGGDGNDSLYGGDGNDDLRGETGNDLLYGEYGNDTLYGGSGNDTLYGNAGNDNLYGEDGDDLLYDTNGYVNGGNGIDTLVADYSSFSNNQNGIHVQYLGQNAIFNRDNGSQLLSFQYIDRFNITGTQKNDILQGKSNNDTLKGGAGNDSLYGQEGDDLLDDIDGFIDGGNGNDTLIADYSSFNNNNQYGIHVQYQGQNAIFNRETGGQLLSFQNVEQFNLTGTKNNDILQGKSNNDTLKGGAGNDSLYGQEGNDSLIDTEGYIDGGSGNDTLVADYSQISNGAGVEVQYQEQSAIFSRVNGSQLLSYTNIEQFNLTGSQYNDILRGGANNDILNGGAGHDTLEGKTGNDSLYGQDGDDTLSLIQGYADGGNGFDILAADYSSFNNNYGIDVQYLGQNSIFSRGDGNSLLNYRYIDRFNITGTQYNDILRGNINNDTLNGAAGNDFVFGGDGEDTIEGNSGNDILYGDTGHDQVKGGSGNDTLFAGAGAGNDSLFGDDGDDTLYLTAGISGQTKQVTGGQGADTFILGLEGQSSLKFNFNTQLLANFINDITLPDQTLQQGRLATNLILGGVGALGSFASLSSGGEFAFSWLNSAINTGANFGFDLGQIESQRRSAEAAVNSYDPSAFGSIFEEGTRDLIVINDFQIGLDTIILPSVQGQGSYSYLIGTENNSNYGGGAYLQVRHNNDTPQNIAFIKNNYSGDFGIDDTEFAAILQDLINNKGIIGTFTKTTRSGNNSTNADLEGTYANDVIDALGDNDTVLGGFGDDVIEGGTGNDKLYGGLNLDEQLVPIPDAYINEHDGNDILRGGDGIDSLYGESGNDTLIETGGYEVRNNTVIQGFVDGGEGIDLLIANYTDSTANAGIEVQKNGQNAIFARSNENPLLRYTNIERFDITGTQYADILRGGVNNDTLTGGSGNDSLYGLDGDDLLKDTEGYIDGGNGNDTLVSDYSNSSQLVNGVEVQYLEQPAIFNRVNGSQLINYGNIERFDLTGTNYNDILRGGVNNDTLTGGAGNDSLYGLDGDDLLKDTEGYVDGGNGIDTLVSDYSNSTQLVNGVEVQYLEQPAIFNRVNGSQLINYGNIERFDLTGTNYNDILRGGSYNDSLTGKAGNDSLYGQNGDDILKDTDGYVDGGNGNDTLVADYSLFNNNNQHGIHVQYQGQSAIFNRENGNQLLSFQAVEHFNITGTKNNDILQGKTNNDTLTGGAGNDTLEGKGGYDTLNGESDNDVLNTLYGKVDGGTGLDTLVADYTQLSNGSGLEVQYLRQNGIYDRLTGSEFVSYSNIEHFNITGTQYTDVLRGGSYADTLQGGAGNDDLWGGDDHDSLIGGSGNDTLYGSVGHDTLLGTDGSDVLYGGSGNDLLRGGGQTFGERDILTGEGGADIFSLVNSNNHLTYRGDGGEGFAIITDFVTGVDLIQLQGSLVDYSFVSNADRGFGSSANDTEIISYLDSYGGSAVGLIAVIQDVTLDENNLSQYFQFV